MRNPYFVGRPPGIYEADSDDVTQLLTRTGQNTGNLLFISALHRVVAHETMSNAARFDPREVAERHDGIVIPAANWFNYHSDWGGLADRIEATGLPCVIVGLGAQSHSFERFPKPKPGTLRLVKVISERSAAISVRGAYTAAALAHYGITNTMVTGCPSLLWNGGPLNVAKPPRAVTRVAVSATRSDLFEKVFDPAPAFRASLLLSRLAFSQGIDYVAQSELFDMRLAAGEVDAQADSAAQLDFLQRVYDCAGSEPLQAYLKRHLKTFFNVETWTSYLKTRDFVLSTRLHGVLASLLAGTPALLVTHDTRTAEMAEFLRIPAIDPARIVDLLQATPMDWQSLYDDLDLSAFNAFQPEYYRNFATFFARNDVATTLPMAITQHAGR